MILYFGGCILEPYVMPAKWQHSFAFSNDDFEESFRLSMYYQWTVFVIQCLTLPLWTKGYNLSMEVAGRQNTTLSLSECLIESLYHVAQSSHHLVTSSLALLMLQNVLGLRMHLTHIGIAAVEVLLANYATTLEFCVVHELAHKIQPLYQIAHAEHRITRGIYPASNPCGLWENDYIGDSVTFSALYLFAIPNLYLQTVFVGPHLLVHTMWPHPKWMQYHILHHTVMADIYAANVPPPRDKQCSHTVSKLHQKLCDLSLFCRIEVLSDLVASAFILVFGVVFHHGFGVGLTQLDWSKLDWTSSEAMVEQSSQHIS